MSGRKKEKELTNITETRSFSGLFRLLVFPIILLINPAAGRAQQFNQPTYTSQFQQNNNYLRSSSAFRQEIARFEITVHREGKMPLSLTQVPRVERGDVIKLRLLDEPVNGIKLDQSLYDWTLLVAFINPNRKFTEERGAKSEERKAGTKDDGRGAKSENQSSVSEEIRFRQKGWYREHVFVVPYDSQPIFFLYPRPNYRGKILSLINKNYNEIKALGEKTIDLAGAYGQISLFLNELQGVLSGSNYYGPNYGTNYGNNYYNSSSYGSSNYNNYNSPYQGYNQAYNYNLLIAQAVERMARGFNISLPGNCWQGSQSFANSSTYGIYGSPNNTFRPAVSPDLVSRLQCVAKNIRLEDFDLSVAKLLQQGGMLLAVQLQQKYPQLSYWINVAALAIDLIVKITKKSPLRIVPAVTSSTDSLNNSYVVPGSYPNYPGSSYAPTPVNPANSANYGQPVPKISLFAENQPDDGRFVTAYPLIVHKWQAEPDPEIISLRPPVLMEPCLHPGINVLKSTDLTGDQPADNFTKDYKLVMSSSNGFRKEFPLKKNIGLGGWELNITPQDLQEFPKVQMALESLIKGKRGFNEIRSPSFYLPVAVGRTWEIAPESQKSFTVGGKRTITIKNTLGNCQCLQSVIYRPSFGGQFSFEANFSTGSNNSIYRNQLEFSPDGKEVSFEIDTTNFKPGAGEIELKTFGADAVKIPLKLYPPLPVITQLKIGKGDREGLIAGSGLEQVQSVRINGRRAIIVNSPGYADPSSYPKQFTSGAQPNLQAPAQSQIDATPHPSNSRNFVNSYVPDLQTSNTWERVVVFEAANAKLTENTAAVELVLEDDRAVPVPQSFTVGPSRPAIVANESKEVEGIALKNEGRATRDKRIAEIDNQQGTINNRLPQNKKASNSIDSLLSASAPLALSIFPVDTREITLNVQNALTDYDFRVENLSVETRLEKSSPNNPGGYQSTSAQNSDGTSPLPRTELEVLDWRNLRITLYMPEGGRKFLGGRRLQFRISDRERGVSDWYTIKQTFVRTPEIASIDCTAQMNGMCEMKGGSIDYISQVSIDGGQSWYPQSPNTLQVQPTRDEQKLALIPFLRNKKLLMIKLRDYPKGEGLFINNFVFSNTVRSGKQAARKINQVYPAAGKTSPAEKKPDP